LRAIEWLNRLAKKQGVAVRQSYLRVARQSRREVGRLMHAGRRKQAERCVRKLRTWTGRLMSDIERKTAGEPDLVAARAFVLDRVKRLLAQKRDDKMKLYASGVLLQRGPADSRRAGPFASSGWNILPRD
jgi:transposase, IS5 family